MIFYDSAAPDAAVIFYNVYGEIVLEFFLIVFWVASFGGMSSYVSQTVALIDKISDSTLETNSKGSRDCGIAIIILGAFVL